MKISMNEQRIKLHTDLENCVFQDIRPKKNHCKGISWFIKHWAHSKMLKNFACGRDSALIEEVLIWCPLRSELLLQIHLLVHFSSS